MKTERRHALTLVSDSGGVVNSGSVLTPFGPLRAGILTSQRTQLRALEESLKCLERQVSTLESKYLEVCDTLIDVTQALARLTHFTCDTTSTDVVE